MKIIELFNAFASNIGMNMFNVLFFCPPEYQWHIGIQNFGCNPIRLIWDNLTKISIFPWISWCTIKTNICIGSHRWQQWQYSDPPWLVLPGYPQLRSDNGTDLTKTKKIFYTCSRGSSGAQARLLHRQNGTKSTKMLY